MRKKILSVMLTICMVLMLMPQMAFAEGGVPYLDASGAQKTCDSATVVNGDDTTWGGKQRLVRGQGHYDHLPAHNRQR